MNKIKFLVSVMIVLLVVGCGAASTKKEEKSINIVAGYRERLALIPGSEVIAILEDVSKADAPSEEISRVSMPAGNPPFDLTINYFEDDIKEGNRYNVRVKVVNGERLMFTSTEAYDPFSKGKKDIIKLMKVK